MQFCRSLTVLLAASILSSDLFAQSARDPVLRDRILHVSDSTARFVKTYLGGAKTAFVTDDVASKLQELDRFVSGEVRQVLDARGWPGKSMVGDSAATIFSRLVIRLRDLPLQERALAAMEKSVASGDASALDLAFVTDRVRVNAGRPQVYGTAQSMTQFGDIVPAPIADSANVDARRKKVGLGSLADSVKAYQRPSLPPGVQVIKPPVK